MPSERANPFKIEADIKHWLTMLGAVLVYTTVLFYSYKFKVAPLFAYQGLTFRSPNLAHYTLAIMATVVVAIAMPRRITRASDFLLWMPFLVAVIPSIMLPQYMDTLTPGQSTQMGLAVAACMLLIRLGSWAIPRPSQGFVVPPRGRDVWAGMILFSTFFYVYMFATAGIPTQWVPLNDVYDVRSEFATATAGTLLGYMLPVQYGVINPIFITRGLYSRSLSMFTLGAGGQVVIYLSEGQKGVLFSTIAMLGVAWLFRREEHLRATRLFYALASVAVVSLAIDALLQSYTWTSLFVRRFLIIPGALTVGYVWVFQDRPKTHFSDVLSIFGTSPYGSQLPSYIVGKEFVGDATTNANVNFLGHGFVSYGYLGMVVVSLVYIVALWAADAATVGLPAKVSSLVFFKITIALASASIFTSLATHGLAAAIALCAVLPRDGWDRRTDRDAGVRDRRGAGRPALQGEG